MKDKIMRFMAGRYGNDRFNQFLMMLAMLCLLLSITGIDLFYTLAVIIMVYAYFRMFSRQIYKRAAENQRYLQKEMQLRSRFARRKRDWSQRKQFRIYRCPHCRQKIRVPKGRGRIAIRCAKCNTEFIKTS